MSKTNRKYIATLKKSKINMREAVEELTANSFKLLNILYYVIENTSNLEDKILMTSLGISKRPFYKAKDELKEKGYLKIVQVGSTKYKWFLGKKAIKKDNEKYQAKYKKDRETFANLVLGIDHSKPDVINKNYSGTYFIEI